MNLRERISNFRRQEPYRYVRRVFIAVSGTTVLVCGLALIFLPGPAILVIPIGLAILATEFVWARTVLKKMKNLFKRKPRGAENEKGS